MLGLVLAAFIREPVRNQAEILDGDTDVQPVETKPISMAAFLRYLLSTPTAVVLLIVFPSANFVAWGVLTWMPTYLHESFDMSVTRAAIVGTFYIQVGSVTGTLAGGFLADFWRRFALGGRVATQAAGLLVGDPAVYYCGVADSANGLIVAMVVFGFCKGVYDSNIWAAIYDVIPAAPRDDRWRGELRGLDGRRRRTNPGRRSGRRGTHDAGRRDRDDGNGLRGDRQPHAAVCLVSYAPRRPPCRTRRIALVARRLLMAVLADDCRASGGESGVRRAGLTPPVASVQLDKLPPGNAAANAHRSHATSRKGQADMCGIVAMFSRSGPVSVEALKRATQTLHHRGPDGQRHWVAPHGRVALGHARLSIIDLVTGDQPIANEDERLHIIVNGEFYDFERIQRELTSRGHKLRTHSDSEIALHLYEDYGTSALHELRGEFAIILWDEANGTLMAVRDRFGVKPLYYAQVGDTLYLASEAKALFAAGVPARWDHESFFQLSHLYFDQDRSLFDGVRQVPPGCYLLATQHHTQIVRYWDFDYPRIDDPRPQLSDAEHIERMRSVLDEAVRIRLRRRAGGLLFKRWAG